MKGRDAIELKDFTCLLLPLKCILIISIARDLCSIKHAITNQFTTANIIFENVLMINIHENEYLPIKKIPSSFVEVKDSIISKKDLESNKGKHHYILHTYDYIFEIICKGYLFKVI